MSRRPNPPAIAHARPRAPRRGERGAAEQAAAVAGKRATRARYPAGATRQLEGTATAITLALIVVAAIVHLAAPAVARRLLRFAFPTHAPGLGAAWGIFTGNLRLAAAPLAGALLLGLADPDARAFNPGRALLDAIIAVVLVLNVVIVGAGFGGYGARMLRYVLPHGPVELAGYCCALTVYASARTGRRPVRFVGLLTAATLALLALAAVLEAIASPI